MYVCIHILLRSISIISVCIIYIYTLHIYTIHIERFSPGVVLIPKCFSSLEMGTKAPHYK